MEASALTHTDALVGELEAQRRRTLALIAHLSDEDLERVIDPIMSPLVWDLGHIAATEDLWLCQRAGGLDPPRPDLAQVYDAAEVSRADRGDIPYLRREEAIRFMSDVRARALAVLDRADLSEAGDRLNADGFVWEMLVQHEHQHNETMLQTLQLAEPGTYAPRRRSTDADGAPGPGMVPIAAGAFSMGDPGVGFAYDNERPLHRVELPAFLIDRTPVTNGAYLRFVGDGGYGRRELWSEAGWAWREREAVERPLYWTADGGGERRFDSIARLDPQVPVMHVSWFEADAYARWAGKRLPSEAEWEKAASCGSGAARARRYPWGDEPPTGERANLDQLAFGPMPVDALGGTTPEGVSGLLGDCWEWTATAFSGYPGFRAFPYAEYSEVFFGDGYRVLRGGSWATRPSVARNTFRNWDLPERRQIFSGFRCARDV